MEHKTAEVFRSVTSLKDTRTFHVSCIFTGFCKTLMLFSDGTKIRLVFRRILLRFAPTMSIHFFILCARIVRIT
eukprot:UN18387